MGGLRRRMQIAFRTQDADLRFPLLELEREGFMRLVANKKTAERIQHMLKTGKPLRN